jgi:hypothetical protein
MTIAFSTQRSRWFITGLWLVCFGVCLCLPGVLFLNHAIRLENLQKSLEQVSTIYVPYVGAILAYYFASGDQARKISARKKGAFEVAIAASVIWNFAVVGCIASVAFGLIGIESALDYAPKIGSALSWLVAPAMGYFFAKSAHD